MKKVLKDLMSISPEVDSVRNIKISQRLIEEYNCSSEFSQSIAENFLIRRKDVQNYMSSCLLSENKLDSFNWSVSVVLSSSSKAEVRDPLLHLEINTVNDYSPQKVVLEFNYQELCRFIEQINEVKDKCLGY